MPGAAQRRAGRKLRQNLARNPPATSLMCGRVPHWDVDARHTFFRALRFCVGICIAHMRSSVAGETMTIKPTAHMQHAVGAMTETLKRSPHFRPVAPELNFTPKSMRGPFFDEDQAHADIVDALARLGEVCRLNVATAGHTRITRAEAARLIEFAKQRLNVISTAMPFLGE